MAWKTWTPERGAHPQESAFADAVYCVFLLLGDSLDLILALL